MPWRNQKLRRDLIEDICGAAEEKKESIALGLDNVAPIQLNKSENKLIITSVSWSAPHWVMQSCLKTGKGE